MAGVVLVVRSGYYSNRSKVVNRGVSKPHPLVGNLQKQACMGYSLRSTDELNVCLYRINHIR